MYNIDKEKLKSIIENTVFSNNQEKNRQVRGVFLSLFSELCDYSRSVNDSILAQSKKVDATGFLPNISVALMNSEKDEKLWESLGLFPMAEPGKRIFIDEGYDKIKQLTGDTDTEKSYEGIYIKNGQVHTFSYFLKFDRSYVEMQELLYKYALHYKLENPIIFSPYSFKSFFTVFDYELLSEDLDFRFEENGLNVIESEHKELFWNIAISRKTKTYDAKLPYGEDVRYVFEFPANKKGHYLLPLPQNNQVKIYSIDFGENSVCITIDRDMDEFVLLEPLEIDETSSEIKTLISNGMIYQNKIEYTGMINQRLISEADIEHSIAPFRNNNVKCSVSEGSWQIVNRYARKYRPDISGRKLFHPIGREYIRFEEGADKKFLHDYINYVLEYLEYYYPEIEWVGET